MFEHYGRSRPRRCIMDPDTCVTPTNASFFNMGWIYNASLVAESKSHYASIVAISISTLVVMLSITLTRGYIRYRFFQTIDVDDGLIFFAMILSTAFTIGSIVQTRWGLGLPASLYPSENVVTAGKLDYAHRPLYCITVGLFQAALCIAYIRIFRLRARLRSIAWILLGAIAVFTIYHTAVTIFECIPISKVWFRSEPGHCLAAAAVYFIPLTVNFGFISFGKNQIITTIITLIIGSSTITCAAMQLICSIKTYGYGVPEDMVIWAIAEMNAGIATVSIPMIAPFFGISAFRSHSNYPACPPHLDMIPLTSRSAAASSTHNSAFDSTQSIPPIPELYNDGPVPVPYAIDIEPLRTRPPAGRRAHDNPFRSKWQEIGLTPRAGRSEPDDEEIEALGATRILKQTTVTQTWEPNPDYAAPAATIGLSFGHSVEGRHQRVHNFGTESWAWAGKDD